jgi:hypothetical protein
MNRPRKLLLAAMALAAATTSALRAGSTLHGEEATTAASDLTKFSLTVENGNPSGNYPAGTLVVVNADVPQAGAEFLGWTGDIAILSNPFLPKTTATIPYRAVTITATYAASAAHVIPLIDPNWGG